MITKLLASLGSRHISGVRSINCRLYCGWLRGNASSRSAERLLPKFRRDFPCCMPMTGETPSRLVLMRAELARSRACGPVTLLTHTYRQRSLPPALHCDAAPFSGCRSPSSCPIAGLDTFLGRGICPVDGCSVGPRTILSRAEQKFVDSMLVVDLIHYAETTRVPLVVVSGDDDLWPGIRFVLLRSAHVVHAISRNLRANSRKYRLLETDTDSRVHI